MRSKYETNVAPYFDWIEAWCRDGVSEAQIAKNLNVSKAAFEVYKKNHQDLTDLLRKTKDYVDLVEMMGAFKRRAEGYDVEEVTVDYAFVKNEETGEYDKVPVGEHRRTKHVPGDERAMEAWMRLRHRFQDDAIDVDAEERGVVLIPAIEENTNGSDMATTT